jgi:hypothetical protein
VEGEGGDFGVEEGAREEVEFGPDAGAVFEDFGRVSVSFDGDVVGFFEQGCIKNGMSVNYAENESD